MCTCASLPFIIQRFAGPTSTRPQPDLSHVPRHRHGLSSLSVADVQAPNQSATVQDVFVAVGHTHDVAIGSPIAMPPSLIDFPYLSVTRTSTSSSSTNDESPAQQPPQDFASVAVALAMATHPRLGAESSAAMLSQDLLRRIWVLWSLQTEEWLAAVCVRADWCIRGIELCYVTKGGSRVHKLDGCSKGERQASFLLAPGEHVVLARGWYGGSTAGSNVLLYQLQLCTSTGRASPIWGHEGGRAFELLPRLPTSDHDDAAMLGDVGGIGDIGSGEPHRGFFEWLRLMRLAGTRADGMDMDDVSYDPERCCVEHRSRGHMNFPHRPLQLLNAQRTMLRDMDVLSGPSNLIAGRTGAVGHLVGRGVRAPPASWEAELSELLAPEFADVHARVEAGRHDEGLAQRLFAMLLGGAASEDVVGSHAELQRFVGTSGSSETDGT